MTQFPISSHFCSSMVKFRILWILAENHSDSQRDPTLHDLEEQHWSHLRDGGCGRGNRVGMSRAVYAGQNQEQDPRPRSPLRQNKVSFHAMPGYSTKCFVPYLCCWKQWWKLACGGTNSKGGWEGKKGLTMVRSVLSHTPGPPSLKGSSLSQKWFGLERWGPPEKRHLRSLPVSVTT